MLVEILLLIGVGAIAGLVAGLLGVGGGTVIVPALIFLFEFSDTNTDQVIQMSVATSMACIVITSISSTYACLLYTSPSPRDRSLSRMPSSA